MGKFQFSGIAIVGSCHCLAAIGYIDSIRGTVDGPEIIDCILRGFLGNQLP